MGTPALVSNTWPAEPAANFVTAIPAVGLMSALAIVPSKILFVLTEPSARSALAIVPSKILADVTALLATVGLGYVPVKSPPAAPEGENAG
ncbi:MAG: hypothetical protein HWD62_07950 [Cyclobacteriaceae bacterium]|nr:MAG: hypothetical protein HWD62_07950 [Cyclobacteriaceae bacterium]